MCGGGRDRRALGRGSRANPVTQTTLDVPRSHLLDGDIHGAQREGVRTPCTSGDTGDPTAALQRSRHREAGPPVRNHPEYRAVPYEAVSATRI